MIDGILAAIAAVSLATSVAMLLLILASPSCESDVEHRSPREPVEDDRRTSPGRREGGGLR